MHRGLLVPGLFVLGLSLAAPARAATITFDSLTVLQGTDLNLEIRAILDPGEDLFSFGFDLLFDSSILRATSVMEGGFLKSALAGLPVPELDPDAPPPYGTFFVPAEIGPGSVSLTLGSLFGDAVKAGATGEGVLALVTFQTLNAGPAGLSLSEVLFFNASDLNVPFPTRIVDGDVRVEAPTPVPEPSTLVLLGVGLLATARRLCRRNPAGNQTA